MKHTYNIFWYIKNIGRRALSVVLCFATLVSLVRYLAPEVRASSYDSNGNRFYYGGSTYFYMNDGTHFTVWDARSGDDDGGGANLYKNNYWITMGPKDGFSYGVMRFQADSNIAYYSSQQKVFWVVYKAGSDLDGTNLKVRFGLKSNYQTTSSYSSCKMTGDRTWHCAGFSTAGFTYGDLFYWTLRLEKNAQIDIAGFIFSDSDANAQKAADEIIANASVPYQIEYNGNGSTGGSMSNSTHYFGSNSNPKLTANAYTKTGYDFAGWNTKSDGSGTSYANKANILNLTIEKNKVITLYAQWTPKKYTVTYDGNGGLYNGKETWVDTNKATYNQEYTTWSNNNFFTRTGYKWVGWNERSDGKGTSWTSWVEKPWNWTYTKDVTLYAQWEPITYEVDYRKNGADSSGAANSTHTYDVAKKLK